VLKRHNNTPARLINLLFLYISRALRMPHVLGMPYSVFIEPVNACNLKCPLCPLGDGSFTRKPEVMSLEDFRRIIDQLGDRLYQVNLTQFGEPFLNKDLLKMIEYAKLKKLFVSTASNFNKLDRDGIRGLVEKGADYISISLDGVTEDTYRKYRQGGSLTAMIENLRTLVDEKKRVKSRLPYIDLQFIIMKHNESEYEAALDFARSLGVDQLTYKAVYLQPPATAEKAKNFLPGNPEFAVYGEKDGRVSFKTKTSNTNMCRSIWVSTIVNSNGDVTPCCYDYNNKFVMGNIFREDFRKIWNNRKYKDFRKAVLRDKINLPMCGQCPDYFFGEFFLKAVKFN